MANRLNDTGVFQLESGLWAFRYTFTRDGKRISKQGSKDESRNPLKTKRAASKAPQAAIDWVENARRPKPTVRKCQRRNEIVRKRRRNFVVFRRGEW